MIDAPGEAVEVFTENFLTIELSVIGLLEIRIEGRIAAEDSFVFAGCGADRIEVGAAIDRTDERIVNPVKPLGGPDGKTRVFPRVRIAKAPLQDFKRLAFAVRQFVDAEPCEVRTAETVVMIERSKNDFGFGAGRKSEFDESR